MEAYVEHFGYLAVLLGTFLEGETVLVLAGFAAHRGYLDLFGVITAAFAGTLCGDQLFYYIGLKHSQTIMRRRPAWQPKIDKAQELIKRHRILIILGFRFLYGLRTVLPFTFGIAGVPGRLFVPLNIVGALIWSIAVGSAGYLFGQALETFFGRLKHMELWIMLGIAVLGGIAWSIHFWRSRQKNRKRVP